jgi:hypothetical protein
MKASKRHGFTPVHTSFLQTRPGDKPVPGPLHHFVNSRRGGALDLYLLLVLLASGAPYTVARPAGVFARALGMSSASGASSSVAKQWSWLEGHQLIKRVGRKGRWTDVQLLREDGSGREYAPGSSGGPYLKLPFAYYEDGWHGKLDLPSKAMLLIALSMQDDFFLPQEKAPEWYGLSPDSAGRGLRNLQAQGLLTRRLLKKPAPASPLGHTFEHHYTLTPPFGPRGKRSANLDRAVEVEE